VGLDGTVFSGWNDGTIKAHDGATGAHLLTVKVGAPSLHRSLAVGHGGTLFSTHEDRVLMWQ
jgi:hypothetical protein